MTPITPAQARENLAILKLGRDVGSRQVAALTTFIQQYEEMEAALSDLTSTSAVYFARKDKWRDDERLIIVKATGDESDFTVAQFRRAVAATKGE